MQDFLQKKRNKESEEEYNDKEISESPSKKKAKITDENNLEEDNLTDLVFKYNINSIKLQCKFCSKEITNNIKFYCDECDLFFCIDCFLLSKHSKEHPYHIIDALNFPLFIHNWTANDELKLLSFIAKCGLNNWEEISKLIENKGQVECESYYYSFYYKNKNTLFPDENDIILDANKNIKNEQLNLNQKIYEEMISKISSNSKGQISQNEKEEIFNKNNSRSILGKNRCVGESVSEVLGARIKRKEFDNEFMNEIEVEMRNLEFNDNDKKNEKELNIKEEVLKDYNLILKEREKRKKFILEKNFLDMNRQNRIESRLNKEEYNLLLFMKPFQRFFENSEFYDLFGNIIIEQQLKLMLKNLNKLENEKNSKGGKISTLEELEKYYENDKGGSKSKKQGKINNHNSTNGHHNNENPEQKDKENNNNIILNENNETNLLMNKMERYFEYEKITKDKSLNEIFDNDEFNLIKEMPLARSTFYNIKIKLKELISKYEDKNNTLSKNENLKESIKKLIDNYQLEIQTSSDIFDFYCKKYNDLIVSNEKELKIEEENKKIIEKNEITNNKDNKELEKNEEENTKSTKHRGRNKKQKNNNEEEKQNKNNKEEQKDKDKDKDKNKEKNDDVEMNIK